MSVTQKIKAMMTNKKQDPAQFSAMNKPSKADTASIKAELKQFPTETEIKQFQDGQNQALSGTATIGLPSHLQRQIGSPGIGPFSSTLPPMFGSLLTPSEEAELKDLEQEHAKDIKKAKLDHFKTFPREFRQSIINILLWGEAVNEIDNTSVPECDRLHNLKQVKDAHRNTLTVGSLGFVQALSWPPVPYIVESFLPKNLSKEDLIEAHMDASMEEELQDG